MTKYTVRRYFRGYVQGYEDHEIEANSPEEAEEEANRRSSQDMVEITKDETCNYSTSVIGNIQ